MSKKVIRKRLATTALASNASSRRGAVGRGSKEVMPEGQVRIPLAGLEERREIDLLPKGVPAPDSLSLPPLGVSDAFGNLEDLGNTV